MTYLRNQLRLLNRQAGKNNIPFSQQNTILAIVSCPVLAMTISEISIGRPKTRSALPDRRAPHPGLDLPNLTRRRQSRHQA